MVRETIIKIPIKELILFNEDKIKFKKVLSEKHKQKIKNNGGKYMHGVVELKTRTLSDIKNKNNYMFFYF